MASHSVTGSYVPLGLNHSNQIYVDAVLTEALANGNTLTVALPASVSKDMLPVSSITYGPIGGSTYTVDADLAAITSHNVSTGETVLTASGNVSSGSRVRIGYIGL